MLFGNWLEYIRRPRKVTDWFRRNHPLLEHIRWQNEDGTSYYYHNWSDKHKKQLINLIKNYSIGADSNLHEAFPLAPIDRHDIAIKTVWDFDTAWKYYIAHVAHCLYLEIFNLLPWRIDRMSPAHIAIMLDGGEYYISLANGYYEIEKYTFGGVTYGDPKRIYNFLRSNSIIGTNHASTIINLLTWCSNNMIHFIGSPDYENAFSHWQYYGLPPVERIINGTIHNSPTRNKFGHHTLGCYGTTGFLRAVLRLACIPVMTIMLPFNGHVVPHFLSINRYMSHGDDPYSLFIKYNHEIPIENLLIKEEIFTEWFIADPEHSHNVGRQVVDLAIEYLPTFLLYLYCNDLRNSRTRNEGEVLRNLSHIYSLSYLESIDLWTRLDDRLATRGGCSIVVEAYERSLESS